MAPRAAMTRSASPSPLTAAWRMVWLIVSPVVSAAAIIAVPSISPTTMRSDQARRFTFRTPNRNSTRFRSTKNPSAPPTTPRATTKTTRSESTGMPKSSRIV